MKTLLEKNLIVITGRSEKPGRPLLYGTSNEFLKCFGLNKLADLPRIEEFEAIAREKMEELTLEELASKESDETDNNVDQDTMETQMVPEQVESSPEPDTSETTTIPAPEPTALFEINLEDVKENDVPDDEIENDECVDDDEVVFDPDTIDKPEDTILESIAFADRNSPEENSGESCDTIDLDMSFDTEDIEPVEFELIDEVIDDKNTTDDALDTDIFEPLGSDEKTDNKGTSDDQDDEEFLPK